jgi:hypothetical protein
MKFNQWTLGLAAVGLVSLGSAVQAEEAQNAIQTALSSTTISGYVNTSAILMFGHNGPNGYSTPGRSFDTNSKFNGFNLDVAKLQIEKPLDEGQWSAGYQLGLLFGPDANAYATSSSGVNTSDFGIKDANVTLRAPVGNGLDFKLGYWESPIGYEVFDAGNNPNYSRSYAYAIEPKQFTGLLVSYRVSEILSLSGGVADHGWRTGDALRPLNYYADNAINGRSENDTVLSYLGSVAVTAPESAGFMKGATLYGGVVDSGIQSGPDVLNLYGGLTMPTPMTGLLFGLAYDYRGNSEDGAYRATYANAFGGYISWQISEKLKLNARGEYVNGTDGTWYMAPNAGDKNELLGVTATVDYSLWANVLTRLEFRWDHDLTGDGIFNDYDPGVHEGTENAFQLALNVIYKF